MVPNRGTRSDVRYVGHTCGGCECRPGVRVACRTIHVSAVWSSELFIFDNSEEVWKWLTEHKGRTLTDDDIAHDQKIVVALSETIRLMAEIDRVIDEHGGWPGAFQAAAPA